MEHILTLPSLIASLPVESQPSSMHHVKAEDPKYCTKKLKTAVEAGCTDMNMEVQIDLVLDGRDMGTEEVLGHRAQAWTRSFVETFVKIKWMRNFRNIIWEIMRRRNFLGWMNCLTHKGWSINRLHRVALCLRC